MSGRVRSDGRADQGSVLVMILVIVVVSGLVLLPMLDFATTLTRYERVSVDRVARSEAVKGAVRVALADPAELYRRSCPSYNPMWTPTSGLSLDAPLVSRSDLRTSCELLATATADFDDRVANAFVLVGAAVPAGTEGTTYVTPDAASVSTWHDAEHSSATPAAGKIWVPELPVRSAVERTEVSGWGMPSDYGSCRVFFPGTYRSAISLTGGEVYFTSGVYYFEESVTFSGSVDVVVGEGTTPGCASDQEAFWDSLDPPAEHGITGLGATFVFGAKGRLVIDATGAGTTQSIVFNQRYVDKDDANNRSAHRVSIMSVNGSAVAPDTYGDFVVPGSLSVPLSSVGGATSTPAPSHGYVPSQWSGVPANTRRHLVSVNYADGARADLKVAGYVATPQGSMSVSLDDPDDDSRVAFDGGVLAAEVVVDDVAGDGVASPPSIMRCVAGQAVMTPSGSTTPAGTAFTLPGFDPAWGTLTGAQISFTSTTTITTSGSPALLTGNWSVTHQSNVGVYLTGPGLGALPAQTTMQFAPAAPSPVPAAVAGGTFPYSYTSGSLSATTPSLSATESRSSSGWVQVPVASLASYVGTSVTLSSSASVSFSLASTGASGVGAAYSPLVTPCITYTYTATPGTVTRCSTVVNLGPSVFTVAATVPGFDTSLGTLTGVRLSLTGEVRLRTMASVSAIPSSPWSAARNDHLGFFLTGPGLTAIPPNSFLPAAPIPGYPGPTLPAVPAGLAGTIFLQSYASGPINAKSIDVTQSRLVSAAVSTTSNLSAFTTPTVSLSTGALQQMSTLIAASTFQLSMTAAVTPCVTYTYTSADGGGSIDGLFSISLQTPVVQKTLLITATTTSGSPAVVSRLKVQVNANGAYAVNSWTLE